MNDRMRITVVYVYAVLIDPLVRLVLLFAIRQLHRCGEMQC